MDKESEAILHIKKLYSLSKALKLQYEFVLNNKYFNKTVEKAAKEAKAKNNFFLSQIDKSLQSNEIDLQEEESYKLLEFLYERFGEKLTKEDVSSRPI
jgi:CO dehydrogenase nickel-insertion accessory protein CooC1